jgi:hypothetical protein
LRNGRKARIGRFKFTSSNRVQKCVCHRILHSGQVTSALRGMKACVFVYETRSELGVLATEPTGKLRCRGGGWRWWRSSGSYAAAEACNNTHKR